MLELKPFVPQRSDGNMNNSRGSVASNIIVNHDFSRGLDSWHPNCCHAFVVSAEPGRNHAVVTNRKEHWQGLEQDISGKVSAGTTYSVSARVGISGPIQSSAVVTATLKLEFHHSPTTYMFIGK